MGDQKNDGGRRRKELQEIWVALRSLQQGDGLGEWQAETTGSKSKPWKSADSVLISGTACFFLFLKSHWFLDNKVTVLLLFFHPTIFITR